MLAPRWRYLRLGPYLRREADKRSYHRLFRTGVYVNGIRRAWILRSAKRYSSDQETQALAGGAGSKLVVFENDVRDNGRFFTSILGRHQEVKAELSRIARPEHIPAQNDERPFIGIHVRMGDFTPVSDASVLKVAGNFQLPVEWYKDILLSLREKAGCELSARVFSDGDAGSLRTLLEIPGVSLQKPVSALHDIFALSKSSALISSSSGFSMWGAYLSQVPRICFPNQRRTRVLAPPNGIELEPECERGENVPCAFAKHVTDNAQWG
jgi:hypothetical protein